MIHDGGYYSISHEDNILSVLDEIDQKIIRICHRNFIWNNLIISIFLGQYPDTPTKMESTIRYGGFTMCSISNVRRKIIQGFMNCAAQRWILILLQVNTIWSMKGIIIAFSIRIISYRYWMRLTRRSYICATKLHITQSYVLKISGMGSWYSNVNVEHYQVWSISYVKLSGVQQKHSTRVH